MAFFLNILLPNRHGDIDMEAGTRSGIELDNMEAGSRSAHYTHSHNPNSMSAKDTHPQFPDSWSANNMHLQYASVNNNHPLHPGAVSTDNLSSSPVPNLGSNYALPLSMQITVPNAALPLLPPAKIGTSLNINRKRSQNDDRTSKVWVVEQTSKMSTIVRLYFP